jgi:hypothetical protein
MNKLLLRIFVGVIALSLAICAAFFSIVGLSKLFAGASIAVIIMASTLESSKLVIASFLHKHWNTVSSVLKFYLVLSMLIIMSITSIGIYGFLSAAYQQTKSKYDLSKTTIDSLASKQTYYESSIKMYSSQLEAKNKQLENYLSLQTLQEQRASQLVSMNRTTRSADRSSANSENTIKRLNGEIDELNQKLIAYSDSSTKLKVSITQSSIQSDLGSELGSLTYISKMLNVSMDKVVNVLIILFIIVFDPLAICMVLVFNFLSYEPKEERKDVVIELETISEPTPQEESEPEPTPQEGSEPELEKVEEVTLEEVNDKEEVKIEELEKRYPEPPKKNKAAGTYTGGIYVGK